MFCRRCGTRSPDEALHCPLCGQGLQPGVVAVDPAQLHAAVVTAAEIRPVYAGFWRRFAAVVLDSLVMFFPLATLRVLFGLEMTGEWQPDSLTWWILSWVEVGVGWLYAAFFLSSGARATLGLQVMDLQVCDLRGQRISFARATWRYFAQIATLLSLGIGYLLQLFSARRQTLHDMLSRTVVVRARYGTAPLPAASQPAWGSSAP